MLKTEKNLRASEKFIRALLAKHFNQKRVDAESLRAAAEKLCEATSLSGRKVLRSPASAEPKA